MNRIEEIKKLAKKAWEYTQLRSIEILLEEIINLCNQEPEGQVIVNPVEDWDGITFEKLRDGSIANVDWEALAIMVQEILTTPKEPAVWVYWDKKWEGCVMISDKEGHIEADYRIKTTNCKIKEVGIYVKDWEIFVENNLY